MPRRPQLPPREPTLLFTGFEPSGDDHASAVVGVLRRRHPGLRIVAWGGPKMAAAGAELVERTGRDAVMGIPGIGKIIEHAGINRRIAAWLDRNPITAHVPVDSPAANFPICRMVRDRGHRVVHLVAPQIWAWGGWRIGKLRRLSDHVCCLLPFEEDWFRARDVPATFVGHPLFDHELDGSAVDARLGAMDLPSGATRVALLPGSRPAELRNNFPVMLATFRVLRREHPSLAGVVAAASEDAAATLRALAASSGGWPDGLGLIVSDADAAIRWSTMCLVVSGTVTLQVARQARPMIVMYRVGWLQYHGYARWILTTRHLSLPNLVAGHTIVPELMPYFGGPERLIHEAIGLIERPDLADRQREALAEVAGKFRGHAAAESAADVIERIAGLVPATVP